MAIESSGFSTFLAVFLVVFLVFSKRPPVFGINPVSKWIVFSPFFVTVFTCSVISELLSKMTPRYLMLFLSSFPLFLLLPFLVSFLHIGLHSQFFPGPGLVSVRLNSSLLRLDLFSIQVLLQFPPPLLGRYHLHTQ